MRSMAVHLSFNSALLLSNYKKGTSKTTVRRICLTGRAGSAGPYAFDGPAENGLLLARLVTHFLTALLFAIVFLLFGMQ